MRALGKALALSSSLLAVAILANPQKKEMTDAEYTAKALSAAPKAIAGGAAVVRVQNDGRMKTIREGKNGFTCLVMDTDKMCNDANGMEFIHTLMSKKSPPGKVGIPYMLAGDEGGAIPIRTPREKRATIIGWRPVHTLCCLVPRAKRSDTPRRRTWIRRPYMMWAGTPYEHAMIPVGTRR